MTSLFKNLKWGLRWGLIVAVGFSLIGAITTFAAGIGSPPSGGPSFLSLLGFYFLGGASGGLLLGLLRPITRHKAGAILVGTLVTAALIGLLDYIYVIKDHWTTVDTVLVGFCSIVGGPVTTLMILEGRSRISKSNTGMSKNAK